MFAQNQQNTLPTTGNVGVGTTSPDVKLQVNGRMQVDSSLVVKDSAVLKNYTLPTLKTTRTVHQSKRTLPNVPSAEEITQNGLDVGEMNKILLQKVEELTLHLIAQEKEIETLKRKVTVLEKVN